MWHNGPSEECFSGEGHNDPLFTKAIGSDREKDESTSQELSGDSPMQSILAGNGDGTWFAESMWIMLRPKRAQVGMQTIEVKATPLSC